MDSDHLKIRSNRPDFVTVDDVVDTENHRPSLQQLPRSTPEARKLLEAFRILNTCDQSNTVIADIFGLDVVVIDSMSEFDKELTKFEKACLEKKDSGKQKKAQWKTESRNKFYRRK